MVKKEKEKKNIEQKSKNNCLNYLKSTYKFNIFLNEKELSTKTLLIHTISLFVVIIALNIITKNLTPLYTISYTGIIGGIPIFFFTYYLFFMIFLNSFEKEHKPFFKTFFVSISIIMPLFILGHILNIINILLKTNAIATIIGFLTIILIVYMLTNFILNFTKYYNTTSWRIISAMLLNGILFSVTLTALSLLNSLY